MVVLTALTGVATGVDAVHGNGHSFVGLATDGAQRHSAGGEPPYDFGRRLHLFQGDGLVVVAEVEQATQGAQLLTLIVNEVGELLKRLVVLGLGGLLQGGDGLRVVHVILAMHPPLVVASRVQRTVETWKGRAVAVLVALDCLGLNNLQPHALNAGRRPCEVAVDDLLIKSHCFKNLGPTVALHSGDTHLRHGLEQALVHGLDEVFLGVFRGHWYRHGAMLHHVGNGLECKVRVDGRRAIADQKAEVADLARLARLHDQPNTGP